MLPYQQIATAQEALATLRNRKRFLGQDELIWDVEQQLCKLQACHDRGELASIVVDAVPAWPYVTVAAAIVVGVVKVVTG